VRRTIVIVLIVAAMLAVSAIPAAAFEYGSGLENGDTYGYILADDLYVEGSSYNSGSELYSVIRTDEMQASGWSYNDNGTQTTGGSFYNDEMQVGGYTISDGRSVGRFGTDEMDVYGVTDNGNTSGHAVIGDVCFGSCPH